MWRHRTRLKLVRVTACCLTAIINYLNQYWLISVRYCSTYVRAIRRKYRRYLDMTFKITNFKTTAVCDRGQWVKHTEYNQHAFANSTRSVAVCVQRSGVICEQVSWHHTCGVFQQYVCLKSVIKYQTIPRKFRHVIVDPFHSYICLTPKPDFRVGDSPDEAGVASFLRWLPGARRGCP